MARRSDHTREELHRMALKSARAIVAKQGLRGLSTRGIAKRIGYTPGTLYQLFRSLDDLILHMNVQTLDELYQACLGIDLNGQPEVVLRQLAARYIKFVTQNHRLWNAVFEHSLPDKQELPEWYEDSVSRLLALADRALVSLIPNDTERRLHEAHVLWAGLYGIASLGSANKLALTEAPEQMVDSLICNYLAGLRKTVARSAYNEEECA
jgi:AcrR family transcriptional regulator